MLNIGDGNTIWWQWFALSVSRLSSPPMVTRVDVTSSSRMASRGGFVTWAKSWVKKSKSGRASFDSVGTVESEPIEPMGSSLTWAMWRTMRRRSSSL